MQLFGINFIKENREGARGKKHYVFHGEPMTCLMNYSVLSFLCQRTLSILTSHCLQDWPGELLSAFHFP